MKKTTIKKIKKIVANVFFMPPAVVFSSDSGIAMFIFIYGILCIFLQYTDLFGLFFINPLFFFAGLLIAEYILFSVIIILLTFSTKEGRKNIWGKYSSYKMYLKNKK